MKNIPVKIDEAGRIIIPKKIRDYFEIKPHDVLSLSKEEDKIVIKKEHDDTMVLKQKLEYLVKKFEIDYIVIDKETIIETSKNYQNYKKNKLSSFNYPKKHEIEFKNNTKINDMLEIKKNHYYFYTKINDYKTLLILVIINNKVYQEKVYSHINMLI